jgi:hypothetical protein
MHIYFEAEEVHVPWTYFYLLLTLTVGLMFILQWFSPVADPAIKPCGAS